jgi:hypothetical protein
MSHDAQTTISGEETDIFAHRFVVKTATGKILGDLGPKGAEHVVLKDGDDVKISGEMKPSELKVGRITKRGAHPIDVEHKKKPHEDENEAADPKFALQTAKSRGLTVLGLPRRRPEHFEILGRDKMGHFMELHVELDGTLRKIKPVNDDDQKWANEIGDGLAG